ncbi:MAG: helix-turn-helix domain-containing protein [Candidatus Rokuibacteriota bacterium]
MTLKDAMTVKEASTYLALDERIVARMAEERRIPAVKVEDEWRFSRKSLQKWQRLRARGGARA